MTWASLALALIKLLLALTRGARERALVTAGEDRQRLRSLHELSALGLALKEVDSRFERMTADEVRAEIESAGDYRD